MKTIECVFISNREIPLTSARKHKPYTFNTQDDLKPGDVLSVADYSQLLMVTRVHKRLYGFYGVDGVLGTSLTEITNKKLIELTNSQNADYGTKYKLLTK